MKRNKDRINDEQIETLKGRNRQRKQRVGESMVTEEGRKQEEGNRQRAIFN